MLMRKSFICQVTLRVPSPRGYRLGLVVLCGQPAIRLEDFLISRLRSNLKSCVIVNYLPPQGFL